MRGQCVPLILRIYRTPSGHWAGRLFEDCEEVGAIRGCVSPQEVEQAAKDAGFRAERIEIEWQ
ncbi:hypothetical protein AWB74_08187 [Caballeronia arvi]|uniref:Uncharacterized protein n=1 Tax=Caballeronia arvi TaxID=1777135 RepID=A0A158L3K7_9BURK|nr:hypothetical protein AWB74_08187 [Caballeronia arvi]